MKTVFGFFMTIFLTIFLTSGLLAQSHPISSVDAILDYTGKNGKIFFFKNDSYWRFDLKKDLVDKGYPNKIKRGFVGLKNYPKLGIDFSRNLDAALNRNNKHSYFFKGAYYVKYDMNAKRVMSGYPKKIAGNWNLPKEFTKNIDASYSRYDERVYFFKGSKYVRYNLKTKKVDPGYPKTTKSMYSLGSFGSPKAACKLSINNAAYFWDNSGKYFKYNTKTNKKYASYYPAKVENKAWDFGSTSNNGDITVKDKNNVPVLVYSFNDPTYSFETSCSVPGWIDGVDITGSTTKYRSVFAPACKEHDINYRAPWRIAGFSGYAGKEIADEIFKKDMETICDQQYNNFVSKQYCKTAASTWFTAVNTTAKARAAFDDGQKVASRVVKKSSVSKGGFISVKSEAGYVTEVKVSYALNGKRKYKSGKVTAGFTKEFGIPIGAHSIKLNVEGIACGLSFSKSFSTPVTKCYKVWGTIFDTEWRELSGCK